LEWRRIKISNIKYRKKQKNKNKIILTLILILFLLLSYNSQGINQINHEMNKDNIPILKWKGPYGSYQDYIDNIIIEKCSINIFSKEISRGDEPMIIIFFETNILDELENEISLYQSNLVNVGFNVLAIEITGGTAEDIKNEIVNSWNEGYNITGAVLIGELPTAWFHHENDFDGNPAEFPCDLYLMDLDGSWIDTDYDGKYDSHTDGQGDTSPEIYIGRIDASNIPGDEIMILRDYFQKVDDYWKGNIITTDFGLTYTDEDWAGYSDMRNDIGYAYPEYEPIWYPNVDRDDYINNRLPGTYEFIQLACHSWSGGHSFTSGGYAYSNEIRYSPPMALFYNLFCCGTLRFTDYNCVGNAYILDTNSPSLTVIGSTKSGSMLDFRYFYEPLGQNHSFGKSFQKWFEYEAPYSDTAGGYNDISWFYGMTILGDPTLYINEIEYQENIIYVDDDFNESTPGWNQTHFDNIQDGIDAVVENGTVYVYNGIYYENINVNKTINLIGEDRNNTIINGGGIGKVIYISADLVSISNLNITNGLVDNIVVNYAKNCSITRNIIYNSWQHGIHFFHSDGNIVTGNIINSNNKSGIYSFEGNNNFIAQNTLSDNINYGIQLIGGDNNVIFHNSFNNNTVYDYSTNIWYNATIQEGNYWSDFDEPSEGAYDNNSDGIVDSSYDIPGGANHDLYPLMYPLIILNLNSRWNLINLPRETSMTMASDLAENISDCLSVNSWDAENQTYRPYIVGGPPDFDFQINQGMGLFVDLTKSSNFIITGILPSDISIDLFIGWNLLGWYQDNSTMASTLAENISGCLSVNAWDSVNQTYRPYIIGGPPDFDFAVTPGMGLFVDVNEESVWSGES